MSVLKSLFGKSPFSALQSHMEKVAACISKLEELFARYSAGDYEAMEKLSEEISDLEHAADLTKNEIRNNLPKGLFLAINRGDLLQILAAQDDIADKVEDIGILMTMKKLKPLEELKDDISVFFEKNIRAVRQAHNVIREMDELLESSFGGKEAEKVKNLVEEVAFLEHEADILQRKLSRKLFNMDKDLSYTSFTLWMNILQAVAALGNLSEKLANRVRMILEIH